ncbi:MAG: hypothetical protein QNL88_00760 [Acidobacteriota bacterium]|nr:hypothetical protein [Acidobacteriota bacterium]
MASGHGEDLGNGVYVSPAENGQLVVTSPRLDLGWRVAVGRVPGTAVLWRDQPFEVVARTAAGSRHRWTLRPPVATKFVAPRHTAPPPSILRTTLVTAAVTLGPRADQERWAATLGVRPRWLTMAGAAAEFLGGLTNLGRDAAAGGLFFIVLDMYLILEGSLRLLSALGGRPCGSVFGWLVRPLYRSSLPPSG